MQYLKSMRNVSSWYIRGKHVTDIFQKTARPRDLQYVTYANNSAMRAKQKLPFEAKHDQTMRGEVLIYECAHLGRNKYLMLLGYAYSVMLWFGSYWSYSYYQFRMKKKKEQNCETLEDMSPKKHKSTASKKYGKVVYGSILCGVIGTCMMIGTISLSSRLVASIRANNGATFTFTRLSPFIKSKTFDAPIKHVTCQKSRQESKAFHQIKIRGYRRTFFIEKSGHFLSFYDLMIRKRIVN